MQGNINKFVIKSKTNTSENSSEGMLQYKKVITFNLKK